MNKAEITLKTGFSECIDQFINTLKVTCGFDDAPESSFASVSFELHNIRNLVYDEKCVLESLEQAITEAKNYTPHDITTCFTKLYENNYKTANPEEYCDSYELIEEQKDHFAFQYSVFCSHTLPISDTTKTELVTEYPGNKMTVSCPKGLPYGGIARLIILYINNSIVKSKSRTINLGRSIKEFVEGLGYKASYIEGGTNQQVMEQLEKLFFTTYFHEYTKKTKVPNKEHENIVEIERARYHLFDGTITWEHIKDSLTQRSSATLLISNTYYELLLKHPVPLSMEAIIAMKKSPLAIDLYSLITYRANSTPLVAAEYSKLKKQFGIQCPDWKFKDNLQTATKYIQKVWPEFKPRFEKKHMVISGITPHVSNK